MNLLEIKKAEQELKKLQKEYRAAKKFRSEIGLSKKDKDHFDGFIVGLQYGIKAVKSILARADE